MKILRVACSTTLLILMISSCGSFLGIVGGAPRWTLQTPRTTISTVYFAARGTADIIFESRTAAYEDLIGQLSEYVGFRLDEQYRRELLETQAIASFGAEITEEFQRTDAQPVTVHLLLEANRRTINAVRREWEQQVQREGQEYLTLRDAARRAYARNQDTIALVRYVEAARAVYDSRTAGHIAIAKEYLTQAVMIMENLRIEAQQRSPGDRTFRIRVVREGRTFAGGVDGASVLFTHPVYNASGIQVERRQAAVTDERGFVTLEITHPGFRGTGRVSANITILRDAELPGALQQDAQLGPIIRQLFRLESEKQAGFSYRVNSSLLRGTILVSILEYDRAGTLREDTQSSIVLREVFEKDGLTVVSMPPMQSEQQSLTYLSRQAGAGIQTGIIGSVEIVTIVSSGNRHIATARGSIRVIDASNLRERFSTSEVVANGVGDSPEAARKAAFRRFGELAAAVVLNNP